MALPTAAQDPPTYTSNQPTADAGFVSLGAYDAALWFADGDSLFAVRVPEDSVVVRRSIGPWIGWRDEKSQPRPHTSAIDPGRGVAWMWDGSVGSVARFSLERDSVGTAYEKYSSHVQFSHAGGLNPVTGRPLAFGGYGYYRVHDLFLTFDDRGVTWVEVGNRAQARPEPRMGAVMATGWHPTKIVIVGGTASGSDRVPHRNDRVIADAWTFDFADSTWTEVPIPEPVRCAVLGSAHAAGDLVVERRSRSVLAFSLYGCPPDPSHDSSEIIRWWPESGRYETAAVLGQAIPVGYAFGGFALSPDSSRAHVLLWQAETGRRLVDADREVVTLDLAPPSRLMAETDETPMDLWVGGLLLLIAIPVATWLFLRRPGSGGAVEVAFVGQNGSVLLACGGREAEHALTPNARRLIGWLVERAPPTGEVLSADKILELFDDLYADPDSSRVAKNRAVDELNDLFDRVCNRPLLERVRRHDDARRYDWKVVCEVRPAA